MVSKVAVPLSFPTSSVQQLWIFCLPTLILSFDCSHCSGHVVISYSCFNLYLLHDRFCWVSFHVLISHLCIFSCKMFFQIICPLFFLIGLFDLLNSLRCIFLDVLSIWNIVYKSFLPVLTCLFIFLMVSFEAQKSLIVILSSFSTFSFMGCMGFMLLVSYLRNLDT